MSENDLIPWEQVLENMNVFTADNFIWVWWIEDGEIKTDFLEFVSPANFLKWLKFSCPVLNFTEEDVSSYKSRLAVFAEVLRYNNYMKFPEGSGKIGFIL